MVPLLVPGSARNIKITRLRMPIWRCSIYVRANPATLCKIRTEPRS